MSLKKNNEIAVNDDRKKNLAVVTGAAGHIGNVLVRQLISDGQKVRALVLPKEDLSSLAGLEVDIINGDVTEIDTLRKAFVGADTVFHLAAVISILPGRTEFIYEVNVGGTQNVIEACRRQRVKRLIYTSSIHAFMEPENDGEIDENTLIDSTRVRGDYAKTKAIATKEVLAANSNELETVVVCPTGVIGPYDFRVSEMGGMFLDYVEGKLKAYIAGCYNFVDVRDVARGLILAAEKGKPGQIYILGGEMMDIKTILNNLEEVTGLPKPKFKMPLWLARVSAWLADYYYKITKIRPVFTSYSIETLTCGVSFEGQKAQEDLGYKSRPLKESISDSIKWFEKTGKIDFKKGKRSQK